MTPLFTAAIAPLTLTLSPTGRGDQFSDWAASILRTKPSPRPAGERAGFFSRSEKSWVRGHTPQQTNTLMGATP